jgi:arsenate reductase
MAQGLLQSFDKRMNVFSAGTMAIGLVAVNTIAAMKEIDIDITHHTSDPVEMYLENEWDYVITVCNSADQICPPFAGKVKHRIHKPFDDPSWADSSKEDIMKEFRRVRDKIQEGFWKFYSEQIKPDLN